MAKPGKGTLIYALLLLAALSFRIGIAVFLPNDDPEHGKVYAQIATNLLDRRVYSQANEPPYSPTLVCTPGYPIFIAAIYGAFGHGNNTAVRIVQALLDTATCGLIALVAFCWEPDKTRKRAASIGALVLAAICPFTAIYVATLLSESVTVFLIVAMVLTTTLAFKARSRTKSFQWWTISGLIAGVAVLFRPDSATFVLAIGLTLLLTTLFADRRQTSQPPAEANETQSEGIGTNREGLLRASLFAAVFTLAFCVVLVPWTIRNWRVFHVFQPLAPTHADIPGDFVPNGYLRWLRTWLNDESDVELFIRSINTLPIDIEDIPEQAFDSDQEKQRVAKLLELYNHPQQPTAPESNPDNSGFQLEEEQPQPTPLPGQSPKVEEEEGVAGSDEDEARPGSDSSSDQAVAMTPAIDAEFVQLARERISRSPFRYYAWLPVKKALGLWFNTHSQYYPFEGELFPDEDLGHTASQQVFLPLFTALTWIYTFLGIVSAWFLWQSQNHSARRYLLLVALAIILRLAFFAFRENPEPRYVVELFPLVSILGGIALVRVVESFMTPQKTTR